MDNITLISIVAGLLTGLAIVMCGVALKRWWKRRKMLRKGKRGEEAVARILASLDRKNNIILNNILLSYSADRSSQIDHILLSTRGIFIIETKSLSGRISGSEHAQYWRQHFSESIRRFYNPLLQNEAHLRALRRLLISSDMEFDSDELDETLVSIVVFTEAWRLDISADDIVVPRKLLPDRHIRRTLIPSEKRRRRWWARPLPEWVPEWITGSEVRLDQQKIVVGISELRDEIQRRERILNREDLEEIAEIIMAANRKSHSDRRHHEKYAIKVQKDTMKSIRQGICPRCGGRLQTIRGRNGDFCACENYPTCRFTCSIDLLR